MGVTSASTNGPDVHERAAQTAFAFAQDRAAMSCGGGDRTEDQVCGERDTNGHKSAIDRGARGLQKNGF